MFAQDANGGTAQDEDPPYYIVEQMPTFQGGNIIEFKQWIAKQYTYPRYAAENRIEGKVVMKFVVERDGTLSNIEVITSPDQSLSDEIIRVMKHSPKWEPGRHEGELVRVGLTFPFDFYIRVEGEEPPNKEKEVVLSAEQISIKMQESDADYVMPTFRGGDLTTFREWVVRNLKYPAKAYDNKIWGTVILGFVVNRDGSVSNIVSYSSPDQSLTDEVIRVMRLSPKWKPGKQDGEPVRVRYILPIQFQL
jgi:TonB family protein